MHDCMHTQDLSNLLVDEDKAEEHIADVLSEVELLHKQASYCTRKLNRCCRCCCVLLSFVVLCSALLCFALLCFPLL